MKYEIRLAFHVELTNGLSEVTYIISAIDYESAFKAAMSLKDHDYPSYALKDVHVYLLG